MSEEQKLYDAANAGLASEVSSLLSDHPEINVNWTGSTQTTALHRASLNDHAEVVKLLLAHQTSMSTRRTNTGLRPFHTAAHMAQCPLFNCC